VIFGRPVDQGPAHQAIRCDVFGLHAAGVQKAKMRAVDVDARVSPRRAP